MNDELKEKVKDVVSKDVVSKDTFKNIPVSVNKITKKVVKKAVKKAVKKVIETTEEVTLKEFSITATIPVCQYGNIQPQITVVGKNFEKAEAFCMPKIDSLFEAYSPKSLNKKVNVKSEGKEAVRNLKPIKSFNEDVTILFDEVNHEYFYGPDKLESATDYVKNFYSPFDAKGISKKCEPTWNATATEITEIWNEGGNCAADFGSSIHRYLAFYHDYKDIGERIRIARTLADANKKKPTGKKFLNPAIPTHPIGRFIINKFVEFIGEEPGIIKSEIIVTDVKRGRCGTIDRLQILDEDNKICRVQDYKINIDATVVDRKYKPKSFADKDKLSYDDKPSTKLTKYFIQLSFYAEILQRTGWTIQGLDAFIFDNAWDVQSLDKVFEIEYK